MSLSCCGERSHADEAGDAAESVSSLNRFRDAFPAACCVLPVCCLAAPIPRSLLRGFFIYTLALRCSLLYLFGLLVKNVHHQHGTRATCRHSVGIGESLGDLNRI